MTDEANYIKYSIDDINLILNNQKHLSIPEIGQLNKLQNRYSEDPENSVLADHEELMITLLLRKIK